MTYVMELITNKKYAEILIGNIGEFMLEFAGKIFSTIGSCVRYV